MILESFWDDILVYHGNLIYFLGFLTLVKKIKLGGFFFYTWSIAYPYLLRDVARLTTPLKSRAPRTSLYLSEKDLEKNSF
jgi:hypothetical protein